MSEDPAAEAAARRTRKLVTWVLIAVGVLELASCVGVWALAHRH
jgi:hypothetical protein